MKSQVLAAIRWTALAQIASQAVSWVVTLVVIRLLAPSDYGLLAIATMFLGFLMMFADLGIAAALVQKDQISREEIRHAFGLVIAIHVGLAALLALAAPVIAAFFAEPSLRVVVPVLSLQLLVAAFGVIPEVLLQREMDFRRLAVVEMCTAVAGSLLTLLLALAGAGVWALVIGALTTLGVKVVGTNVLVGQWYRPAFSFAAGRALLASSAHAATSRIVWFIYNQADVFIAGKWLGSTTLGLYSVSMHLASLPNQRISGLVNRVAFPAFSRIQGSAARVSSVVLLGVRTLSILAFPVFWGLASVAPELVHVLLGEQWHGAITPLQIVSLIMPLRLVGNFVPNAVRGIGRFDVELASTVLSATVMISAFLVGVNWGLIGLCLAWLAGSPLVFFWNMGRYAKALETPRSHFFMAMFPSSLAALLMALAVVAARWTMTDWSPLGRLSCLIGLGAVTYVVLTLLLNRKGLDEARDLLRGIMRGSSTR